MRVAIYQPRYFPQLHYFNRMINVDAFVILDNAQYTKALSLGKTDNSKREKSYQSDTPVKLPHGITLLTVPIVHKGYLPINETLIDYTQKWPLKHLAALKIGYAKSAHFKDLYDLVKELLTYQFSTLAHLNTTTILWSLAYLLDSPMPVVDCTIANMNTLLSGKSLRLKRILVSNDIVSKRPEGFHKGTEWTTAICQELGATEYLHGKTAKENYMDTSYYKNHHIQTIMQAWVCKAYTQQFEKKFGFWANLSILDLLFNTSIKEAQAIIGME